MAPIRKYKSMVSEEDQDSPFALDSPFVSDLVDMLEMADLVLLAKSSGYFRKPTFTEADLLAMDDLADLLRGCLLEAEEEEMKVRSPGKLKLTKAEMLAVRQLADLLDMLDGDRMKAVNMLLCMFT